MKAKDFIREFGWKEAKLFVDENISAGDVYDNIDDNYVYVETNWTELKQYVDAYELVQRFGGLKEAKAIAALDDNDSFLGERFGSCDELKKTISLVEEVENCNEN